MCEGERGSGPKGAGDLCLVSLKVLDWDFNLIAGLYLSLKAVI